MKREYVRPVAQVEVFETNEFCANPACGMKDGKYIFTCDAKGGYVHITYNNQDVNLGSSGRYYSPCAKQHITDGPDEYYDGWVDCNKDGVKNAGDVTSCLVWVEGFNASRPYRSTNWHASASLTRDKINVERS